MPPSKQYDRTEALEAAMTLFWRTGYESTTYDDLVEETGASRYGLYGDFGDKRELWSRTFGASDGAHCIRTAAAAA